MHNTSISRVTRSRQQARAVYDGLSRWYDWLAAGFEERPRAAAVRMLDVRPGDRVLEIGCGTGGSLATLARSVGPSGSIHGLDLSQGMLKVARERVARAREAASVWLQQGDALRLPFPAACLDRILISFTLELFDTPEIPLVLAECMRVLRPAGRICVLSISKAGGSNLITRLYEWIHEKLPQYADCRPIYVRRALQAAGFRILQGELLSLGGLQGELVLAQAA